VRGRCVAVLQLCYTDPPDVEWATRDDCPSGRRCSRADGFCFTAVGLGDACDATTQCADGSRCVGGRCIVAVGPGDACTDDVVCPAGFVCAHGACAALPTFGQPCSDRCLDADCVAGSCVRRPDGASCADDPGPYFAYYGRDRSRCEGACDEATQRCVPRLAIGAACAFYPDCARGLRCFGDANDHGVCAPATCTRP
jgi:hypothetical protein